ncbi:MAG TPA: DUF3300 domain-containing protein [Acetobacteraceae bacterium]|nr:DUF3300 domain-containing protein [Acetobacteraceae bacterium]
MHGRAVRLIALLMAMVLPLPQPWLLAPVPAMAQAAVQGTEPTTYNAEQLDAMLAPIALYPDSLLTQILMASTFPLQIVEASRWLEQPGNAQLKGDALTQALESQDWDPSVKSLVPFPQVLAMLNNNLDWTQQLGYAFATQQADVMASVQRLRAQAQQAGALQSTTQQTVSADQGAIVIQPANPQVVYVPVYNPTVVYGPWPYPALPPVYFPPPPGYVAANAFVSGLAFAAGVAVVGSLWGWAQPSWYHGNVNVNVNRWNNINVNRTAINSNVWRPPPPGVGGRPIRPPGGPVGTPARLNGLPPNAIGRQSVQVPSGLMSRPPPGNGAPPPNRTPANRPTTPPPGQPGRPAAGGPGQPPGNRPPSRPSQGPPSQGRPNPPPANRPVTPPSAAPRPPPQNIPRPAPQPARAPSPARYSPPRNTPPAGAFGGVNEGARAAQYGSRGAQSRSFQQQRGAGGARGGFRR